MLSILISCKSPYCTEIDQTPCIPCNGIPCIDLCGQAERLVQKLLEYPDDWICILENEKCIDCSYYLQSYYKMSEGNRKFYDRVFKAYANSNCKITRCVRIPRNKLSNPQKETELGIIIIYVSECHPCILNPWALDYPFEYYFEFNIINEQKLELISLGPPSA